MANMDLAYSGGRDSSGSWRGGHRYPVQVAGFDKGKSLDDKISFTYCDGRGKKGESYDAMARFYLANCDIPNAKTNAKIFANTPVVEVAQKPRIDPRDPWKDITPEYVRKFKERLEKHGHRYSPHAFGDTWESPIERGIYYSQWDDFIDEEDKDR